MKSILMFLVLSLSSCGAVAGEFEFWQAGEWYEKAVDYLELAGDEPLTDQQADNYLRFMYMAVGMVLATDEAVHGICRPDGDTHIYPITPLARRIARGNEADLSRDVHDLALAVWKEKWPCMVTEDSPDFIGPPRPSNS